MEAYVRLRYSRRSAKSIRRLQKQVGGFLLSVGRSLNKILIAGSYFLVAEPLRRQIAPGVLEEVKTAEHYNVQRPY